MNPATLRRASMGCLLALPGCLLLWYGWWFPPTILPKWLVLALLLAPVGLALLACTYQLRFGLLLGGVFNLFYFAHGVMEAISQPEQRLPALLETLLAAAQIVLLGAATVVEKRSHGPKVGYSSEPESAAPP